MTGRRSFGNVRRKPSGKWEARYTHPETGDVFYRYFITKGESDDFLAITESELLRGEWLDPNEGARPVRRWADDWFASLRKQRPRTLATYRYCIDRHIVPALGDVPIARLSPERVDAWLTAMQANPKFGDATVNRAYKVLNLMMKVAVQRRYVRFNPCEPVEAPADPRRDQVILNPSQVADLAEAVEPYGPQYRAMVLLAAYGGLRWGEVAGLGVQHVDWLRRRVRVERQLHPDGRIDEPKSKAGVRWVEVPAWLIEELATAQRVRRPSPALEPEHSDLLFLTEQGQRLHPSNFTRRVWKKALAALPAEVHGLHFHDLRHTAVALYLESGRQAGQPINPKELQVRMGHSSIQMTLDRYGHLLDKVEDAVVEAMPSPFTLRPAAGAANVVPLRKADG